MDHPHMIRCLFLHGLLCVPIIEGPFEPMATKAQWDFVAEVSVYIPLPTQSMHFVGPRGRGYWGGLRSRYGRLGLKEQVLPDALRALPGTAAGPPPLLGRRRWVAAAGPPPLGRCRWAAATGPPPLDWERVHCGTQGRDTRPRPQARTVCVQEENRKKHEIFTPRNGRCVGSGEATCS
jgi:hypothetical protein